MTPGAGGGGALRVLAVEPSRAVRLLLRGALSAMAEKDGWRLVFTEASDAFEGLWLFARAPYDAAFVALDLAPMRGADLMRALRARPDAPRTALVALTAVEDEETRRRVEDAGGDALLATPFTPESLAAALAKALPARPESAAP